MVWTRSYRVRAGKHRVTAGYCLMGVGVTGRGQGGTLRHRVTEGRPSAGVRRFRVGKGGTEGQRGGLG